MKSEIYPYHSIYNFLLKVILPIFNGLAVIACLSLLKRNRDARNLLMIAVAVDIFFSPPFARVMDADNMCAYAATIPFIGLFPVSGLNWPMGKIGGGRKIAKVSSDGSWLPLTLIASVLIVLSALAPMLITAFAKEHTALKTSRNNGLVAGCIRFSPGSSIYLTFYLIFDNTRIKIPAGPVEVFGEFLNNNNNIWGVFRVKEVHPLR